MSRLGVPDVSRRVTRQHPEEQQHPQMTWCACGGVALPGLVSSGFLGEASTSGSSVGRVEVAVGRGPRVNAATGVIADINVRPVLAATMGWNSSIGCW